MIEILSLGAGVQSTTMLLMSIHGELPLVDHAIFADTGWEPQSVYDHLDKMESEFGNRVKFHRVKAGNIRDDSLIAQVRGVKSGGHRWASMPIYTNNPDGLVGSIRRQCTSEYKIRPIEKHIRREILGLKPRQRAKPKSVRQWFGISFDERQRAKESPVNWKTHYYPLITFPNDNERVESGPLNMTRSGCLQWLHDHGYPEPSRSACIGCPYHSDAEWREMKLNRPEEFADACEVDRAIRHTGGMRGEMYLHRSCVPLEEIDFRSDVDKGQMLLPMLDECEGMCGV